MPGSQSRQFAASDTPGKSGMSVRSAAAPSMGGTARTRKRLVVSVSLRIGPTTKYRIAMSSPTFAARSSASHWLMRISSSFIPGGASISGPPRPTAATMEYGVERSPTRSSLTK